MCGITALLRNLTLELPPGTVARMTEEIRHRGPDDEGEIFLSKTSTGDWQCCAEDDIQWRLALGVRRLSIMDLSQAGHMPMIYQGKYWIVYNGEVYNFLELRQELMVLGHTFRSASDTEVILAAYAQWGTSSFARLRGMWGFVLFDGVRNEVILCRDRLGIKPLYLWQRAGMVAVASEIKQFRFLPGFKPVLNVASVAEYLQTGYENPERSFFRDVQVVPSGTWLTISFDTLMPSVPERYWYPEHTKVAMTDPVAAGRLFADKLRESVALHLRSDVSVGCALSGGMDSSAIAVLVDGLKENQDFPLHTFTSTSPGYPTDEQEYVDDVIAHIRAMPHYVTPDPATFLQEMDRFLYTHDEPVGSLSIYAGYCIARLTRESNISVTLNGQGGDEILSGYWQSYFLYLRRLVQNGQFFALLQHLVGSSLQGGNPLLLAQIPVMFRRYLSRRKPASLVRLRPVLDADRANVLKKVFALSEHEWRVEQIRTMFLPRLLKWDDRNSMAFSVEGRYPFLDHELIELCLSFASQTLYHHGWTKWPLRVGLRDALPGMVLHRRSKFAFEVPQDVWLCGPLRPSLEAWLKQDRPLWQYVERTDVRELAQQTWQFRGKESEPGQALFRLFVFDRWVELFGVVG
ncbi:MAG TPA: asparagine synthase (glutamine-hydrolyzing) [Ktedonobacteraceae bacterium]|nr:asparagine synthase (glutamine-hydrolyzing) [Ktedonobacteraceae bacterium]